MLSKASAPTLPHRPQPAETGLTKVELLVLYRKLMLIRLAEEKIRHEYDTDAMKTPVHLGLGQEAIAVGVCEALPPGTKTFGTYRNHALYLTVTQETDRFFAELYGRATGSGKGKAGSMHLSAPAHGLMATSAVVGTTIPLAVGAALAAAYQGKPDLVVAFFGDGAVEEGVFWESMNFACLHRLRILFVCEDNGLAIHTPTSQRQGFRSIPDAVRGFHCHVASHDGSDLLGTLAATQRMLTQMAREPKPGLLHLTYYRLLEHVGPREDFEAGYRQHLTAEERERVDPVVRFEKELYQVGCSATELAAIRTALEQQLEASVQSAQAAPFPSASALQTDVWVE